MAEPRVIELELPRDLEQFTLPPGVERRLQTLLDRQDQGEELASQERMEAEGLVESSRSCFHCSNCEHGGSAKHPIRRERKLDSCCLAPTRDGMVSFSWESARREEPP